MQVLPLNPRQLDIEAAKELANLANAVSSVDSPHNEPVSGHHEQLRLRHGWDDHGATHLLLARTDEGVLTGAAEVDFPRWDNPRMAEIDLRTHPRFRGRGTEEALLSEARSIIAETGRTLILSGDWRGSEGAKFLLGHGFAIGSADAQRRVVMSRLDWPRLDELYAACLASSAAYDIVELPTSAPAELVPGLLELQRAMNDAPLDDLALEDDVWSDERYRGYENAMSHRGIRVVRLVARRRSDGELGGHTVLAIEDERPWLGFQEDTSVVRGHRGHRLGLRLKLEMLRLVAARDPQVRQIDTWNAESNTHMIAVNDALGCVVVGRALEMQHDLATS